MGVRFLVIAAVAIVGCSDGLENLQSEIEDTGVSTQALPSWVSCNPGGVDGPPETQSPWIVGATGESCTYVGAGNCDGTADTWYCAYPSCWTDYTQRLVYHTPIAYQISCAPCGKTASGVQMYRDRTEGRYNQCCTRDTNWCSTHCSAVKDNCGYSVSCAPCPAPSCQTCASMGYTCGTFTNNCGQALNCGGCGVGGTCVNHQQCTCRSPYYLCDYGRCGRTCTPF